ncbi:MAG: SelB C-terminal domain-containing protein, partial [Lachnospiraceae bacterium]
KRGSVLAPKNSMKTTTLLDVRLNMLPSTVRILENNARLHLFTGTSEVLCRVSLLDAAELGPGERGFAQLRLEEEIAVRKEDRFVVRFYSPMETIGGGVVLESNPARKKRFNEETVEELKQKESGSSEDILELHIKSHGDTMVTVAELGKLTALSKEEIAVDIDTLKEQGTILVFPMKKDTYVWHRASQWMMWEQIEKKLQSFHLEFPYRYGMKKAEIHMTFMKSIKPNVFDAYVELLEERGLLKRHQEFLCLAGFEVKKDEKYQTISAKLKTIFAEAKYDFARYSELDIRNTEKPIADDILSLLLDEGSVVKVADDLYTLASLMEVAKELVQEKLAETGLITIAEVRDGLSTSRKSAKPILEYMDGIKVTKRNGTESERVAYQ